MAIPAHAERFVPWGIATITANDGLVYNAIANTMLFHWESGYIKGRPL
ncbi:MAG: hypothetical protein LBS19_09105 [Clostridiales bacterium]|nr:hypothetical protein [Clostridiales bacterium]